ncbi:MAG: tetratricopeptide repeat protein [Acidobacteria bacterium]|nr:tetratricopeptide repeat protein [Acidobacteriota bacterium]
MQRLIAAAVIVIAGLVTYANSYTGVFVFDDRPSIVDNPYVRNPAPWAHPIEAMKAPRNITVSGRPVASFTFALNYALAPFDARNTFDPPSPGSLASADLFQRNVWGYHALNLAIHLIGALALFGIVRRTLDTAALTRIVGTAATPLAFLVALAWTVHPLQTGSVTYIVQRVESLMGMFMLLTLYCAIRMDAASSAKPVRVWPGAAWMLAAQIACLLGMGSKEVMVGAPLIVLLWDWTFLTGTLREIFARRWPLYLGLAATWIMLALLVAMDARPLSSGFGFAEWPWWRYLATQAGVVLHYLKSAFVPALVLDYSWPAAKTAADILLPALGILLLLAGTVWQLRRRSPIGFAGAAFFVILAPSSSVLPIITEIAAEHRMYVPLAAVLAVVIVGAYALLKRRAPQPIVRDVAFWTAMVIIAVYAYKTDARNADYLSDERIWFDTVQKQPHNARARNNYASDLLKTGQAKVAAEHLTMVVAQSPDFAEAQANLGVALAVQGLHADALPHFERALEINPFYTAVYENIAEAYGTQNQLAKAVKYFLKALDQKPDDVALLNKAAWILATAVDSNARDGKQAIVLAQHAVDITKRSDASSLDSLAVAFAEDGRFDDAVAIGAEALSLARARGDRQYPLELEQRLAHYRAKKPFRQ